MVSNGDELDIRRTLGGLTVEHTEAVLTNSEVLQVLKARGADGINPMAQATASEKVVHHYLQINSAGVKTREELQEVIQGLEAVGLTLGEVLQIVNLVPASAVEVHLIVTDCEARLDENQVDDILRIVREFQGPYLE